MIQVEQALALIRAHSEVLETERLPLSEAMGRVLAEDLLSPRDLPPFDNSAMDGYALRWHPELTVGSELKVTFEQSAGAGWHQQSADACRIMTGARIPDGLDCVVPVEEVSALELDDQGAALRIALLKPLRAGQNLRRAGEDIARGQLAVAPGTYLGAEELMLLRGVGCADLLVRKRPKCSVLCTGAELVDDAGAELQTGQIYNTNGPFLCSELVAAGAEIVFRQTLADDAISFLAALERAVSAGAQVVISTGAVSMGRYDFIPDTLQRIGANIVFHKVQMRPGKPLLFARLAGGQLFFGLPGNPVSTAVGARFFVSTALRKCLGMPIEPAWQFALAESAQKKPEFHLWQKAQLLLDRSGVVRVRLLNGQESFKTKPLLHAKVWAVLPAGQSEFAAGSVVAVYPRRHHDAPLFAAD